MGKRGGGGGGVEWAGDALIHITSMTEQKLDPRSSRGTDSVQVCAPWQVDVARQDSLLVRNFSGVNHSDTSMVRLSAQVRLAESGLHAPPYVNDTTN